MAEGAPRRYRLPILLGSLLLIVAGFLQWWRAGGETVGGVSVPESSGIGLEGPGVVIFGAAVLALLLLDIGYMRGRWGFVLDAPWAYLLLGIAAGAALVYRLWELWSVGYLPLPERSPGIAAAAAGVFLVLYGAGVGFTVRHPR
ncbi:MAG TPA: hypothetical protein VF013_11370 [Candidatus Limnocylindria bacterium]